MLKRHWHLSLAASILCAVFAAPASADDDATQAKPLEAATDGQAAAEADAADADDDLLTVPQDASAEELHQYIEKVTSTRPTATSREEFIANLTKQQQAAMEASTKLLEMTDITDEQAITAVKTKINALRLLARLGDEEAEDQLAKFSESLKNDPRPAIANLIKLQTLAAGLRELPSATEQQRDEYMAEFNEYLDGLKAISRDELTLAMTLGNVLENVGANQDAAALYQNIGELAAASDDEQIKSYGERFEGMARRVDLPGNKIKVFGPLLNGEQVNWEDYRGKVVLVDFWATWCGPCIAELPNVKQSYETYHSRGFDVIGISLDDDKEKVKEFVEQREIPWPTIYDPKSNGWDNPLARYYGISGIPTAILVDKQGKVVSLNARGEALGELLTKLIGPANETTEGEQAEPQE